MKKKIIILLLTFILFFPFIINAKEIERDWGISWGGDGTETISDFKVTSDDGLIVCGSTSSTMAGSENIEGNKIFLSKHDKNGKVEWQKFFSENEYTLFRSVDIIPDKGYLIRGTLMNETRDAIIILFDFDGNIVWTKEFKKNDTDIFIDMLQIDDESFFVVGTTESSDIEGSEFKGKVDVLLIKYDFDGNIIYKKTWGTKDYDEITESYINNKNELIICGTSTDAEGYKVYGADAFILKYDFDGNLIQEKLFGGDGRDTATGVIPFPDDSLLMILSSNSSSIGDLNLGNNKVFHDLLVKFDENLDLLWVKDIGLSQNTRISDYVFTEDNELVILMNVNGVDFNNIKNKGKADSVIIKYDENFDLVFQKGYGGNGDDILESLHILDNKQIITIGYTTSTDLELESHGGMDGLIVYFDKNGDVVSQQSYGGSDADAFYYITTNINNLYMYGLTKSEDIEGVTFNGGKQDVLLAKYSLKHNLEDLSTENGTSVSVQKGNFGYVTPMPDKGYEVDEIIIEDISGNEIETKKLEDGTYSFPIYDDVKVEVIFKEKLVNPKTGLFNYIGLLLSMLICSFLAFWFIMKKDNKYEL